MFIKLLLLTESPTMRTNINLKRVQKMYEVCMNLIYIFIYFTDRNTEHLAVEESDSNQNDTAVFDNNGHYIPKRGIRVQKCVYVSLEKHVYRTWLEVALCTMYVSPS